MIKVMANNMTINDLAGIIKGEFDNVNDELKELKVGQNNLGGELKELKQGQENIELKLTNVAYRFEVDDPKNQLNLLRHRVDSLEHK